ncbi:glycosyltransferase family 4 protein [Parafrigoribacterium soli]|uniref:glycosyltransferase family 4 protein n=1 Tax=Parafrigoribacterium soli TaxID=3144663 RepID=UPI0032ED2F57
MKVVIVSQYYPPEPVPIPHALAQELAERGHDVRVLTAYPNYPEGKLMSGYKQRRVHVENDGNVRVRRIPIHISHSRNPLGRLLNYGSFALSSLAAGRFTIDADVVYVYATQMTAAIAPSWWYRHRKTPFVLHVQDLWPESITGSSLIHGGGKLINCVLTPWLRRMYSRAAATIAIGPTMARMLAERGAPVERVHTVYNWGDEVAVDSSRRLELGDPNDHKSFRLMYAGNVGELQDLEVVLRAVALVRDLEGFSFEIVGSGVAEQNIKDLAAELDLHNVVFRGRVASAQMGMHYARADFQMVPLKDLEIFGATIPSKLQASLANAVPVITTVSGDVRELVLDNRLGLYSPPGNPGLLAETFRTAYAMSDIDRRQMAERAREFYAAKMSMKSGVDKIERILASAVRLSNRKKSDARKL